MGYEDLAYGIALHQANWIQLSCRSAVLTQVFDYAPRRILGHTLFIPEKPVWYSYYNIRNLILIWRQYGCMGLTLWTVFWKFLQSSFRILVLEDKKIKRLQLLFLGALAGIKGENGKGHYP